MAHTPLFRLLQNSLAQALGTAGAGSPDSPGPPVPSLSRRQMLRCSVLATGATMVYSLAASGLPNRLANRSQTARIAIVGAGLAGLNAAYQLQKVGIQATVYEAKTRVGGRIQSRPDLVMPGLVNDLGAAFINSDHGDVLTLVEELGLDLFDRRRLTQAASLPELAFFFAGRRIDPAELAETLAPLADQIGQDNQRLAEDFDRYGPSLDALSVADYLDLHGQKIGPDYGRSLIEASIRSEYGVEPSQASALQLLYNLPQVRHRQVEPLQADELFLVKGGSGLIPQRLAARLGDRVQTGWRLQAVTQAGEGFRLRFNQGSLAADYVILALPLPALRRVDLQVPLPEGLGQFIQEGGPGRNEKLFAGFRQRLWLGAHGFTGAAWSDRDYSGLWEDTQRQPEYPQGVLTFFLGGDQVAASDESVPTQGQRFVDQLGLYLPRIEATVAHRYARTAWAKDPDFGGAYTNFRPGQYTRFRAFLYGESNPTSQSPGAQVGNLLFAGEPFSQAYYGYMNGAAQTGRLAATAIAQRLLAIA